jgi:ribA/ribD-fused uncharacterized protein
MPRADNERDGIYFYEPVGPYGWLSTYSEHVISIAGERWSSVESFYQAQKFVDALTRSRLAISSPAEAKAFAQQHRKERRGDWSHIKEAVMLEGLRAKFTQNGFLRDLLLQTGNAALFEASPVDSYWGIGPDGAGRNRLGELTMLVRRELTS